MTPPSIAKKLGLKKGLRALIIDPPSGYRDRLNPLPADVTITDKTEGKFPFLQIFVHAKCSLQKAAPHLLRHVDPQTILWITYPKKSAAVPSDLSREEVRSVMIPFGWRAVSIISIDDTWSALRFRPVALVKSHTTNATVHKSAAQKSR